MEMGTLTSLSPFGRSLHEWRELIRFANLGKLEFYFLPLTAKTVENTNCSTCEALCVLRDSKGAQPLWWGPGRSPGKQRIKDIEETADGTI
jgi:hypothetical protein